MASRLKVNKQIRVTEVMVIAADGEQLGSMTVLEGIAKAEESGFDLVEVAPTSRPPVCRIMDYGKYKYEQSRKDRAVKSHQKGGHLKEVKFRLFTGEHDLDFKVKHAQDFLEERNKVKVTLMFRGREMPYREKGWAIMTKIQEKLQDVGQPEYPPKLEGRNMVMILAPKSTKE
ncbi:MAG: translation initiation factor IF-3 [Nitrospira sp.]